jgi:hypothetical protein
MKQKLYKNKQANQTAGKPTPGSYVNCEPLKNDASLQPRLNYNCFKKSPWARNCNLIYIFCLKQDPLFSSGEENTYDSLLFYLL